MRVAPRIELDRQTARELRALSRRVREAARVQQRARVILLAAAGWRNKDIAAKVALDRRQVALWRQRFLQGGIEALRRDAPRPGRAPVVTPELESRILRLATEAAPQPPGRWSSRALARQLQVSATTIRRVWQRHGVTPGPAAPRPSAPPPGPRPGRLALVALCLDGPGHVLVLGVDPDAAPGDARRAPDAPRAPPVPAADRPSPRLDVALDAVAATRVCRCDAPSRDGAGLRFLRLVDRQAPRQLALHVFAEDEAMPRHPAVAAWLARHPRFALHRARAGASWRDVARRFLRPLGATSPDEPGADPSAEGLAQAIGRYLADREAHRRPFLWP